MEDSMATGDPRNLAQDSARLLAEPYAFALITWPAVLGLMVAMPDEWSGPVRIVLWIWLGAMHLAAYGGGRGAGFGNAVLLMSGIVAAACATYPSQWTVAWLPALLIILYTAQRLRIHAPGKDRARRPADEPSGDQAEIVHQQ
jgi:hypothetical protein